MKVFLSSGTQPVRFTSWQLKSERNAREVSKAYTILQRNDVWAVTFWKLNIFFSFLNFSFFLFKLQSLRRLGIYVNNQFVILRKKTRIAPKFALTKSVDTARYFSR